MSDVDPSPNAGVDNVTNAWFDIGSDKASQQKAVRRLMLAALQCAILVPGIFLLRFGTVDGYGWGVTIFFVMYCLLATVGIQFRSRSEYHSKVAATGGLGDKIAAFWLVSCVFGPFFGWIATSAFPISVGSWHYLYAARVALAVGAPLITMLPMTRYVRGKAALISFPIMVVVTTLAIWSGLDHLRDLIDGPRVVQVDGAHRGELILPHTGEHPVPAP